MRSAESCVIVLLLATCLQAAPSLPSAKPEDVGMSSERLKRVGAFVERLQADGRLAGAVTLVARRGAVVHREAHGFANVESRRRLQADDIFAMASMTKPITTVAVLMLLEEQRLLLDDPVHRFLPEFREMHVAVPRADAPGGYVRVPARRAITIHDLLGIGSIRPRSVSLRPRVGLQKAERFLPTGAATSGWSRSHAVRSPRRSTKAVLD